MTQNEECPITLYRVVEGMLFSVSARETAKGYKLPEGNPAGFYRSYYRKSNLDLDLIALTPTEAINKAKRVHQGKISAHRLFIEYEESIIDQLDELMENFKREANG